jgi:hypothetical protein|tara:strand:+ start:730 stop:981 length:252 start_codon:yes stop_codon:yes gene_type:complete
VAHGYAKPVVALLRYKHIYWAGKTASRACAQSVIHGVLKGAGVELILVVDHHHGVLIGVRGLELRHADRFLYVFFYKLNARHH